MKKPLTIDKQFRAESLRACVADTAMARVLLQHVPKGGSGKSCIMRMLPRQHWAAALRRRALRR